MNSDIEELKALINQLEKFPGIERNSQPLFSNIVAGLREKVDSLSHKIDGESQLHNGGEGSNSSEQTTFSDHGLNAAIPMNSRSNLILVTLDGVKDFLSPLENGSKTYVQNDFSNKFYTSYYGYRIFVGVDFYKDKFNFYIKLTTGDYDDLLRWPFSFDTEIVLLNQVDEAKSKIFTLQPTISPEWNRPNNSTNSGIGSFNSIALSEITGGANYVSDYLRNNRLYFQMKVLPDSATTSSVRKDLDEDSSTQTLQEEFQSHSFSAGSVGQTCSNMFIFTVGGVGGILTNLKNGSTSIHSGNSHMFYSSNVGYKMQCTLTIDQEYVKIRVTLTQGKNDGIILWPFQKRIRLVLINQVERSEDRVIHVNTKPAARPINSNQQIFLYCRDRNACDINILPTGQLGKYDGISDFLRNDRLHIQVKVLD